MGCLGQSWLIWVTLLDLSISTLGISRLELFPYGPSAGDELLDSGNDQTRVFTLDHPLMFFDGKFSKIYVSTNGFIATATPAKEEEYLGKMPTRFGMIAALLGDLDTSDGVGKVYFRQDSSPSTLQLAGDHVSRAFPDDDEVTPTHVFIVTWVDMTTHKALSRGPGPHHRRNTFQLVIASVESTSYAILLYPRDGLKFLSTHNPDGRSSVIHAGFSKGQTGSSSWSRQGVYYRTTDDKEASVQSLSEKTNSGKRGVWVYEIGTHPYFTNVAPGEVTDLPPEDLADSGLYYPRQGQQQVVEYPTYHPVAEELEQVDLYQSPARPLPIHPVQYQLHQQQQQTDDLALLDSDIQVNVFSYNSDTCENNRQKCSPFADCKDHASGYCCHCRPGYFGNGKQCVSQGKPQRMNGKMHGRVYVGNSPYPVDFASNDLHSYVVSNDGRAYVAISAIPLGVGISLQPLAGIGGVIGWAFALEQPGYVNGFSIVGGEFTRKAEVTFLEGGEKLTITQEFKGIDQHDHLVVDTQLEGRIPELPQGATVQIDPYTEIYQYSNNIVTSSSTREYVVSLEDGTTETKKYQWRESVTYQSCAHDESARKVPQTQMLRVEQVFVMYDTTQQLMRYAMSNKIGDMNGGGGVDENACYTGRHGCDTNAMCHAGEGTQYTCKCASGFTGDGRICYDIDECRESPQVCSTHALCNNQPGTFRCECVDGYQFASDGQTCVEGDRPVDHCQAGSHDCDIPERARCSYSGGSAYICSCLPGYVGDGRSCQDIDECQPGRCHPDAQCYNTDGSFSCQCRPGFYGDGFYCSSEREKTRCETHRESALSASEPGPRGPRPLPGQYVPTCDVEGNYELMQCHGSIGQCWCVDANGLEISGTRTGPGSTPTCSGETGPIVRPTPRPDIYPLPAGTNLLFSQSGRIEYVPLDGYSMKKSEAKTALHLPEKVVVGVAYDCVDKMVYWTDITTPAISKASVQGGDTIPIIRSDLGSPEGIAIDHLSRTMFWTDSMKDRIEVASLDGAQRRVLIDTDLVNPRAIIADPVNGFLYWCDWNREAPKIEASHMDGTNRRLLARDGLSLPNGLTYDPQSSLLCWADAGTHKMECMNPSQSDRREVTEAIQYPFGLTAYGKNLYYTDWTRNAVITVDRHTGRELEEFHPQKKSRLYGITAAYAQCPSGQNYCSVNNGGCTHLCLATPGGRTCKCPDNAVGVSCVESEGRY
ncbi:nidogen-1 isoform X1 [Alosa sapidissima]|uniref:nidogen-1 isoform X1 n=1 Tax=Alosa sapidissima TaxID=34773 RepID=UPI001C095B73|nr:nidogen-1 isoform X1 [Alosa sapidissima]